MLNHTTDLDRSDPRLPDPKGAGLDPCWIYDWNQSDGDHRPAKRVEIEDQTLRDGLQSPSVNHPGFEGKWRLLELMVELGVDGVEVGLPAAGPQVYEDVLRLCQGIGDKRLPILVSAAARTVIDDIVPIARIAEKTGIALEVGAFIGSSYIRQMVEKWELSHLLRLTERAVDFAVRQGLSVKFVTEDTTRAHPDHLRSLYSTAIASGARRVCIADTVGHATPAGTRALVRFIRRVVQSSGEQVAIDWHGHRDRGLSVANALAAAEAGVDRVHGTALGVGERVGNTPLDLLLINLDLLGWSDRPLDHLNEYCRLAAELTGLPIPVNYPVFGQDAFRTATGVHAAAIRKAMSYQSEVRDAVYSSVPASRIGRRQRIEVGPMSGEANVFCWLEEQEFDLESTDAKRLAALILQQAKSTSRLLRDQELWAICRQFGVVETSPEEDARPWKFEQQKRDCGLAKTEATKSESLEAESLEAVSLETESLKTAAS